MLREWCHTVGPCTRDGVDFSLQIVVLMMEISMDSRPDRARADAQDPKPCSPPTPNPA